MAALPMGTFPKTIVFLVEAKYAKYKDWKMSALLVEARDHFNRFIRNRDSDENGRGFCISSGRPLKVPSKTAHAGHYYPAKNFPQLRFNEDNVHLQSEADNYYLHGNAKAYRVSLISKIGYERVKVLDEAAKQERRGIFKWDRVEVIDIIEKYKALNHERN